MERGGYHEAVEDADRTAAGLYEVWPVYLWRRVEHRGPDAKALCGAAGPADPGGTAGPDQCGAQSARHHDRQRSHAVWLPDGRILGWCGLCGGYGDASYGGADGNYLVLFRSAP